MFSRPSKAKSKHRKIREGLQKLEILERNMLFALQHQYYRQREYKYKFKNTTPIHEDICRWQLYTLALTTTLQHQWAIIRRDHGTCLLARQDIPYFFYFLCLSTSTRVLFF